MLPSVPRNGNPEPSMEAMDSNFKKMLQQRWFRKDEDTLASICTKAKSKMADEPFVQLADTVLTDALRMVWRFPTTQIMMKRM